MQPVFATNNPELIATLLSTPIKVEAQALDGRWKITSISTDELADKVVAFLTSNPFEFYGSGSAPSAEAAKKLVQGARERASAGIPFTRFAVLNAQSEVIGEFAIGFADQPGQLEMAGRGLDSMQSQGIGREIVHWCLHSYLPLLANKGFRVPLFAPDQGDVPWDQKQVKSWVNLEDAVVTASVHPEYTHCRHLLEKAGFVMSQEITKERFQGVHDGRRCIYTVALNSFVHQPEV